MIENRKVVVIGAGTVGTTYIYSLIQTGMAGEIALIDIDQERVKGEVMDLSHCLPFIQSVNIKKGNYSDCSDAQLIVITAGAKQESGQSRTELVQKNAEIISAICDEIKRYNTNAVLLMVTNPVDTLTQLSLDELGWSRNRVIGSGTVLDSARLKYILSDHCGIDARDIHAYVIGEHGDSEVTPWSMAHVSGLPIGCYCQVCKRCDPQKFQPEIAQKVRDSAYHIIDYKGATNFGIGLSLVRISGAILRDEKRALTVSTMLDGEYGINNVCISVPCIVGSNGVETIIQGELAEDEQDALKKSSEKVSEVYKSINVHELA